MDEKDKECGQLTRLSIPLAKRIIEKMEFKPLVLSDPHKIEQVRRALINKGLIKE